MSRWLLALAVVIGLGQFSVLVPPANTTPANPIAAVRLTDWTTAGVVGGIPTTRTQCGTTIAAGASATTINNAIAACAANHYVLLGAGSFTLTAGLRLLTNNVTLRGSGADATLLTMTGDTSCCGLGATVAIVMGDSSTGAPGGAAAGGADPDHQTTWTASSYAQGQTQITLASTTGLAVNAMLYLDQLDDASDGYPATGDIVACDVAAAFCSNQGGNVIGNRGGNRSTVQVVTVTNINGSLVTFTPGLHAPNWRAAQSPGAYWNNTYATGIGLEALSVDWSAIPGDSFLQMKNLTNSWVLGVRDITTYNSASGAADHYLPFMASHVTIRSNYDYGSIVNGLDRYFVNTSVTSELLVENNICHFNPSCFLPNGPSAGDVYAFNYVDDQFFSPAGSQTHDGVGYDMLFEGNNWASSMGDVTHSTHFFETHFRNHHDGQAHNPVTTETEAFVILTNNRFFNFVGNVIGDNANYTDYQSLLADDGAAIYVLGWMGNNSGTPVANDTNVHRTLFRWMNWDSVTSTNHSGTNDQTGIRACTNATAPCTESEVPSGITNYAQPIPGSTALPVSLYATAKPVYFGSVVWPPIGPDVTNGNIAGFGGHANLIPARVCFNSLANDAAYGSSSPRIKTFNATTCYTTP